MAYLSKELFQKKVCPFFVDVPVFGGVANISTV